MNLSEFQIVTFGVIALSAVIFALLERRFPYNLGQTTFRRGFFDDFFWYNLVQSYILGVVISLFIAWIDTQSGLSRLQVISDWPIWAQLLLFLVTHDLYIYWFHRAQHHSKFLWRFHEAHHSPPEVDFLSGVRSHPVEILINQTIEFAPIVLLGAAPEVAVLKGAVSAIWGMFIHSNLDVRLGFFQYFINGPEMHRWHHAEDERVYFANYSTKIAIWDWIFGTAFLPKREKPMIYGLPYRYPEGYFRQTVYAFRPPSNMQKPEVDSPVSVISTSGDTLGEISAEISSTSNHQPLPQKTQELR